MFSTFANIAKIPDLRKKIFITCLLLVVYRFGVFMPLPGIDTQAIKERVAKLEQSEGGKFFGLADMFAGGAISHGGVFGLTIMPYISASIIMQLLVTVVPALEKLQKEGDVGRKKINQYTRMGTAFLCIIQGYGICSLVRGAGIVLNKPHLLLGFELMAVLSLTAGTMFLMWLGEQIDQFGIGSGISLIIMCGIISRLPVAIKTIWDGMVGETVIYSPITVIMMVLLFFAMVVSVVFITQGQRRIPVQQTRRLGYQTYSGKSYMPLSVNIGGVIPIIFAQSLLMIPSGLGNLRQQGGNPLLSKIGMFFYTYFNYGSFLYIVFYVLLIVFFAYFYSHIQFNPIKISDDMKQYGTFFPGIRPGQKTAEYLYNILNRITLAGAVFLAVIAIVPQFVQEAFQISDWRVAGFYGGTGLLIVVGVALDLVQRIESHLIMQHYEGFLKGSRIRGRRS